MNILDIPLRTLDGQDGTLRERAGKVLLIVNVASECGLTPQYADLERLYQTYRRAGLVVAGFPSNDFGGQEPGSDEEIADFCSSRYQVSFPLFAKIPVRGEDRHPLYEVLTQACPEAQSRPGSTLREKLAAGGNAPRRDSDVLWNFEKFLVSGRGEVVARFAPDVTPFDPLILDAIDGELDRLFG